MIKSSLNSPDPGDPIASVLDALTEARRQLEQLLVTVDPLLEDLADTSIEDVRPRLGELMQQLLENEGVEVVQDRIQNFNHVFWDPVKELPLWENPF